ncbi:hypothetical protein RKD44_007167 [Streptomyces collinus]
MRPKGHPGAKRGYAECMTDVVDSDELLRRMHRARSRALEEGRHWRARSEELRSTDPEASREAAVRTVAYEAVLRVLDEVLTPGRSAR